MKRIPKLCVATQEERTFEFIKRANLKHDNFYNYDDSVFISATTKIIITCPIHGNFSQVPNSHLNGSGCPNCGNEKISKKATKSKDIFVTKANKVHNNKFNYDKTDYINCKLKVIITCPIHGDFLQTPDNHLSGRDCKECSIINNRKTFETFVEESKTVYGEDRFTYFSETFTDNKVKLKCNIHNYIFTQSKTQHRLGCEGCKLCAKRKGWSKTSWLEYCDKYEKLFTFVYIIKCYNDNEQFIKIGLTSQKVSERFSNKLLMPYEYEIKNVIIGKPIYTFSLERKMHKVFNKYSIIPTVSFGGQYECFSTGILKDPNFQMFLQT